MTVTISPLRGVGLGTSCSAILIGHQLQLHLLQQAHGHQPNLQLGQSFAKAHPLAAAKGQQGLLKGAIEVALRAEFAQIRAAAGAGWC